jgi:hypothetical protein
MAMAKAVTRETTYDSKMKGTTAGRRYLELREVAHKEAAEGHREAEHTIWREAFDLFDPEDQGASAAAACHDLAESYLDRELGSPVENLLQAKELYERALRSPDRKAAPRRYVITLRGLATCLRRLVAWIEDPEERRALASETERCFRDAYRAAMAFQPLYLPLAAGCLSNLGNWYWAEDRIDEAVRELNAALRLAREADQLAKDGFPLPDEHNLAKIALNLAGALSKRCRTGDSDRAVALTEEALGRDDCPDPDKVRLTLATLFLDGDPRSNERGREVLRMVRPERLDLEGLLTYAALANEEALQRTALRALYTSIEKHWQARGVMLADHLSDHEASRAQRLACTAASIHLKLGEHAKAFLVLENNSGVRYHEAVELQAVRPRDPVSRALIEDARALGGAARDWDRLASVMVHLPIDAREVPAVDELSGDDTPTRVKAFLAEAWGQARRSSDQVRGLRDGARRLAERHMALREAVDRHDPEAAQAVTTPLMPMDLGGLSELLRRYPGHAFVRILLGGDLLVVSVWAEGGGGLQSAGAALILPKGFHEGVVATHLGESGAQAKALTEMLASLDVSDGLPPHHMARAVLLPSFFAGLLPLVALGAPGRSMLDRFDSVIWLPSLAGLRVRQETHPPRSGLLTVAPGDATDSPTRMHDVVLGTASDGEARLVGAEATLEAIAERAATADVVRFFAHGKHDGEDGPALRVADGTLHPLQCSPAWFGLERVELWACESGVNLPSDWMTPPVDEGFGLDIDFLHHGARSAIGTLWPVSEYITACLLHRFRLHLAAGDDAAKALCAAQRWWRDEAVSDISQLLDQMPREEALVSFLGQLGMHAPAEGIARLLGPGTVSPDVLEAENRDRLLAHLRGPSAWAGYRFVGAPEHRACREWTDDDGRELTADEKRDLDRLLADAGEPDSPQWVNGDDLQEAWLKEHADPRRIGMPSPEQAIEVARAYRDRFQSCRRHNLLLGLAWLHEALAAPGLERWARDALCEEAAHLWLDLAEREAVEPPLLLMFGGPDPVAIARAKRLLQGLDEGKSGVAAARLRLKLLEAPRQPCEPRRVPTESVDRVAAMLRSPAPADDGTLHLAATACELLGPTAQDERQRAEMLLAAVDQLLEVHGASSAVQVSRLHIAAARLAQRAGLRWDRLAAVVPMVPVPDLIRRTTTVLHHIWNSAPELGTTSDIFSDVITSLEGAQWGYPSDSRETLWRTTGTPGPAYRYLVGILLNGIAQDPARDQRAAHAIACLQYCCDLRLTTGHRLMRAEGLNEYEHVLAGFFQMARHREAIAEALADAAFIPGLPDNVREIRLAVELPRLDPFALTLAGIREGFRGLADCPGWQLATLSDLWRSPEAKAARTAAFEAARGVAELADRVEHFWADISDLDHRVAVADAGVREKVRSFVRRFADPGLNLAENEALLAKGLAPGSAMVAAQITPPGSLVVAVSWASSDGRGGRLVTSDITEPTGGLVRLALCDLLRVHFTDDEPTRGRASERREAWSELRRLVEPLLEEALGPALAAGVRHFSVVAPGALRPLPWLGLEVSGRPLYEHVGSLRHLPSLGFARGPLGLGVVASGTTCLLAEERERGDTRFGKAAVRTLRALRPPDVVVSPHTYRGTDIVETDYLVQHSLETGRLRLYGVGHLAPLDSMVGLCVPRGRVMTSLNTLQLDLSRCASVELWASTAGAADLRRVMHDEGDRLPGLAHDFIACGALGVLDLAWPVPDLLKALVCERYGLLHARTGAYGPPALCEALRSARALLLRCPLRGEGQTQRAVLEWIDGQRRQAVLEAGSHSLHSFADAAGEPTGKEPTASALLDELLAPVHFAAFRWWGV